MDGNTYATTTCQTGGDIILPNTPYKYGYTFQGWSTYTQIEYLESTGTQYIDTEYELNLSHDVHIIAYIKFSNPTRAFICGSLNSYVGAPIFNFEISDSKARIYYRYAEGQTAINYYSTQNIIHDKKSKIEYTQTSNQVSVKYDDNIVINQHLSINFITSSNILLFNDIRDNSVFNLNTYIYRFQIYDNNTLVRDFIPVLDPQNIPCMYDKVSETFFYNQGTGNFIAGPVINQ